MDYKNILDILAPCGLNCQKCCFNSNGEIRRLSIGLQDLLGSFNRKVREKENSSTVSTELRRGLSSWQ